MCTDVINAKDALGTFGSSFGKSISSAVLEHFVLWANSTPHRLGFLRFHQQSAANWKTSLPWFLMPLMWLVFQDWIRLYSIVMDLLQSIWHLLNCNRDSSSSWLDSSISEHKKACSKAGFDSLFSCKLKRASWFSLGCYVSQIIWNRINNLSL